MATAPGRRKEERDAARRASRPRIVLVEALDAAGAAPADAVLRARALEKAGCSVHPVAVGARSRASGRHPIPMLHDRSGLRDLVSRTPHDRVVIASAERGGGVAARWLAPDRALRWWPSGIEGGWRSRIRPGVATAENVLPPDPASTGPAGFLGLDGAVIDRDGPRRRLSLWDGDYVLVPARLSGAAGAEALRAFATVAAERDELDLVVLSHPDPGWIQRARSLGIAQRVHFADAAPRDAERVWASAAAAILIATEGAISGGLLVRMLDAGSPLVVLGASETARVARSWLADRIGATGSGRERSGAMALERALDRVPDVERAIECGRALAARHGVEEFAARLAAAMQDGFETGREAA